MLNIEQSLSLLQSNGVRCQLDELVRYRALARKLNLQAAGNVKSVMSGALTSRFKGRGMEFDEARHYQPGDDIRSIDWRVTARTGKTHTKLYREERERPVLIYIDLSASMHFGTQLLYKSIQALHAAALITFSALSRGDKIGCMVVTDTTDIERKPKSTAKHALGMLNQMVQIQQQAVDHSGEKVAKDNNSAQLAKLSMLARPGTLVYVISDFSEFDQHAYATLGKINRHCEVRPLRIFDPIEQALPVVKGVQDVVVTNGQQEQHILLGDNKVQQQYSDTQLQWFSQLKAHMVQAGLHLREVSAAKPIEQQLATSKAGLILGELV